MPKSDNDKAWPPEWSQQFKALSENCCMSNDPGAVTVTIELPSSPLPADKVARKEMPLVAGLLDYFPAALAEVAHVSYVGNKQHNDDQPLHWARGKSMDHEDCLVRHLVERGTMDVDGLRHSAKVAWRALALLQEELEREAGAPLPRGAKVEGVT